MKLIVRADASTATGTGHLMRCLALAQAWQAHGGKVVFITACESESLRHRLTDEGFEVVELKKPYPDPSDWEITAQELRFNPGARVVLDGYHFDPNYHLLVKEMGHRLLVIDDMAHLEHYYADIILNQNIGAEKLEYKCKPGTRLLLGTSHVLLRREFWPWKGWQRHIPEVAQNVLVTMGGSDPENVTLKVIRVLEKVAVNQLRLIVVVGGSNPHSETIKKVVFSSNLKVQLIESTNEMAELMAWADLAVSAGGSTCWELAYMGVPTCTIILSENQVAVAESLSELGAAYSFGWYGVVSEKDMAQVLTEHLLSYDMRYSLLNCGKSLIHGNGVKRVTQLLKEATLDLKEANIDDCYLVWEWANDPVTRVQSFTSEQINWEDHKLWFESTLFDPRSFIFIAFNDEAPVGLIRFNKRKNDATISISVAPGHRGRGYSSEIIKMGTQKIFSATDVETVHAYVKPSNAASKRAFVKAGFDLNDEVLIKEQTALHFVLRRKIKKC